MTRRTATLRIQLLNGWPADAQADVAAKGERLLAFLAENASTREAVFETLSKRR